MEATYGLTATNDPGYGWGVVGSASGDWGSCVANHPTFEFAPCEGHDDADLSKGIAQCGCPAWCLGTWRHAYCELPCGSNVDCPLNAACTPSPGSCCPSAGCAPVFCQDAGASCDVPDAGPGTCLPMWMYTGPSLFCSQGGTAAGACNPDPLLTRANLDQACPVGQFCVPGSLDGGTCAPVCDPTSQAPGCPPGTRCGVVMDGLPSFGACVACLPRRAQCSQNSDCCGGDCEPGCSFDYTQNGWGQGCMECR